MSDFTAIATTIGRLQNNHLPSTLSPHYYPSTCGGKPCVTARRPYSPPQQSQRKSRGLENLGIDSLTIALSFRYVLLTANYCIASNTTIRCRHRQKPRIGRPRSYLRVCAYILESIRLYKHIKRVYPEQSTSISNVVALLPPSLGLEHPAAQNHEHCLSTTNSTSPSNKD
jgi:hypothetical protein